MMNYIVLDLEWNQSAKGKKYTLPGMPFEIIQMGAVKLDNKFDVIDEFDRLVCPQVYPVLHSVCGEVTGITQEMLAPSRRRNFSGVFTSKMSVPPGAMNRCSRSKVRCTSRGFVR